MSADQPEHLRCCGQAMQHIYHQAEQKTRGWWCPLCNHFEPAIAREKQIKPEGQRHDDK